MVLLLVPPIETHVIACNVQSGTSLFSVTVIKLPEPKLIMPKLSTKPPCRSAGSGLNGSATLSTKLKVVPGNRAAEDVKPNDWPPDVCRKKFTTVFSILINAGKI